MKFTRTTLMLLALIACACTVAWAQAGDAPNVNGTIIERAPYQFPAYEQLPPWMTGRYTREAYDKWRAAPDLEFTKIKYVSDGLKISGFIFKPKTAAGQKLPVLIFNRGGLGERSEIGAANFNYLYEMHRYASEGFVVLASQYRGYEGAEGRDEAGGADTRDVLNLVPLAKSLGYADTDKMYMWGYSRGAIMTLQAIREGVALKGAVVVGAPTDYNLTLRENPGAENFFRQTFPDYDKRKEEHLRNRSAVTWAEKLDVPLLISSGGSDTGVTPTQTMALAQKMEEHGKFYELIIYAGDDHEVSRNREDRIRRTVEWFKNPPSIPIFIAVEKAIREQGVEAAVKHYHELKKTQPLRYDFREGQLNQLGYQLLSERKVKEAIEIFKLNVAAFPDAFNTYDSLAEAYAASGDRELAIRNYQKSLELNPRNTNATEQLKRLNQN